MTNIEYVHESTVTLYKTNASDLDVARAAWVSQDAEAHQKEAEEGRVEGLINFLWKNRHTSPFEHGQFTFVVDTPIFVAREFMRHRTFSFNEMCLAGSTQVVRLGPNGDVAHRKNSSIETIYQNWHHGVRDSIGRTRLLPSCRNVWVRSFDEDTLEPRKSRVVDVVSHGVQTTYLVEFESGHKVRSTKSHRYFTPDGWKTLGELSEGSVVYRSGKVAKDYDGDYCPPRTRQGIQVWTTQQKPRVVPAFGARCYVCDEKLAYDKAQIDHRVPVVEDISQALDITNLAPICAACHREKTNREQALARRGTTASLRGARIVSISDPQQEETYDLVLEGPHHNFLAAEPGTGVGGVVVHNSGRYTQLPPRFYVPPVHERPLQQTGKVGSYTFDQGNPSQRVHVLRRLEVGSQDAWDSYQDMLRQGVAKEVARMVLPVNIMTRFWATANPLNLMKFLSLRTDPTALYEIRQVARQMEAEFEKALPITHAAWRAS